VYIQKVGDKWRVFVEKHGHRPSKLCDTKLEAQRWGVAKEIELDALKGSKGKTFAAATAYYLKTVSPTKVDAVEWETRRFAAMTEFFGAMTPLTKITSSEVGKWRDKRLETVKGATVLREANLLRNLFMDLPRALQRSALAGGLGRQGADLGLAGYSPGAALLRGRRAEAAGGGAGLPHRAEDGHAAQ
jgi:hypothetical protein